MAKSQNIFDRTTPFPFHQLNWGPPPPYQDVHYRMLQKLRKYMWWQPEQDLVLSKFLEGSSMHGLKYVSQPKRNLVERLFWIGSFLTCVIGATVMIAEIWQRYYDNPVIVTLNPKEIEVDLIPFPAITICNINPFRLSKIREFEKIYKSSRVKNEKQDALESLRIINAVCHEQPSFLETQGVKQFRGEMNISEAMEPPSQNTEANITRFLLDNTQPCNEMLRLCVWGQEKVDCGTIFKPIITDYGKCCAFNMLPQELMEYFRASTQTTKLLEKNNRNSAWSKKEVEEWSKWNYDIDGFILNEKLKYPRRQRRAGTKNGLSILVDPDYENYFCPSTDSEGIKVLYHVPLDAPRLADLGLIVGLNREVFLEVNPDVTIADEAISSFRKESRKCYFGSEYKLQYYRPYTRSNCLEECWIEILYQNCNCALYYVPHNSSIAICSSNPGSNDFKCVTENEVKYLTQLQRVCKHCMYTCNDLEYNAEVTNSQLQPADNLWKVPGNKNESKQEWMSHRLSIIHIFMGVDSTVPKLRQKLYHAVDLIASTGGLLGLYIGFSVLSAVEIVYFTTMRICCKRLRKSKRYGPISSSSSSLDSAA